MLLEERLFLDELLAVEKGVLVDHVHDLVLSLELVLDLIESR